MTSEKKYEVVVGIDFGSSGSGFAFSFMNENDINHGYIFGANVDNKVPSEIILDDALNIVQFGATCKQYLKEKGIKVGHYFKGIKMHLYQKKKVIYSTNTNKSLPLVLVIEKVLEKLKELCLEELKKMRKNINESNIKWVVTVPAIWENYQKGIMMEACIKCGLINEDSDKSLFFALEPEAASLYCSRNKNINQKYLQEGNHYIICDLGGGTGDIVAHKVGSNQKLEEIIASCGGDYGSNEIDKKIFENIIYKIFGYKDFNSLLKRYKELNIENDEEVLFDEWSELERQIKDFKEGTNFEKINKQQKFPINFSIFEEFFQESDLDITNLIQNYNDNCLDPDLYITVKFKKKWIVELPYILIYKYIQEQAFSICKAINNILDKNNSNINAVIFVGGYCSNEIIISLIKERLKNKVETFLQPSKPCLAIMEGAVLFGLDPNIINTRIARYTIGQETNEIWDEEKHSIYGEKVYDKEVNEWYCKKCFSKFIEINQKLKINQEITNKYIMIGSTRYCTFHFFQTLKPDPKFTFEVGVEEIGEYTLDTGRDYPINEREIQTTMKFGGTFIDVKSIHVKSGKKVRTKFNLKFEPK